MKLLILSVGRDIVDSAERQLNRQADAVIRKGEIPPTEIPELRQEIYQQLKIWQGERIDLVLSGPVALSFTLGQLIGLNHFDVRVQHYDALAGCYREVAPPTRLEVM